jgi:hypothetical protein
VPAIVPRQHGFWMRRAIDAIGATGEAMFPENDLGAPTWKDADVVGRTLEWMDELALPQRRLVMLLFVAVELGSLILLGRRFSRAARARREDAIRRWRRSPFFPLKVVGESLKGTLSMIYLSHPDVLSYMGAFAVCEHPNDPLRMNVVPGALDQVQV